MAEKTSAVPGDSIVIGVSVENRGSVPATDVIVRLLDGTNVINSTVLPQIAVGGNKSVYFQWSATAGATGDKEKGGSL